MRTSFIIKAITIAFLSLLAQAVLAGEALDAVAANVNDSVITQSELNKAMATTKKQILANHLSMPPESILHKQILDQLINRALQLQIADQLNITASDEDIDNAIKRIAEKNHLTTADIYQKVAQQGLTKAAYRKELRDEIILEKVQQQEVGQKITVSTQEVNDFMQGAHTQSASAKKYHLEEILISLPDEPTSKQITDAKQTANNLLQRLHAGLDFHKAAMSESNGKNALQGGDLGWLKAPEIPTAFVDYVLHMQTGEISSPIQTSNGFHILRLVAVQNLNGQADGMPDRKQVEELIFQRKIEEELQHWISRLRSGATIEIHDDV